MIGKIGFKSIFLAYFIEFSTKLFAYASSKDLICFRRDRALFEAVSFSLNNGDILQVCGPNGSGKTTLHEDAGWTL